MIFPKKTFFCIIMLSLSLTSSPVFAKEEAAMLRLATTPNPYKSGLLSILLSHFERKNRLKVEVVVAETEKAFTLAENGEVDAVLVNDPDLERAFIEKGFGSEYNTFMHSYFVIVGPSSDPAKIKGESAKYAFYRIAEKMAPFISGGDESDTHQREKMLWESAYVKKKGGWYSKTGKDMNETILLADEKKGYTICDKFSYALVRDLIGLDILVTGEDPYLKDTYSIIAVNPQRHPRVRYGTALMLIEYLASKEAQDLINDFKINGEQLFHAGE